MFGQDFTGPALLEDRTTPLPVPGCHRLWRAVPDASGSHRSATGLVRVRSPLLAESRLMSFPPATEMFQFAGFASTAYGFSRRYPKGVGFPIRKSSDHRVLPSPRSLSQGATSFIASRCQGIHRMPFSRLRAKTSRAQGPAHAARNASTRAKLPRFRTLQRSETRDRRSDKDNPNFGRLLSRSVHDRIL